MDPDNTNMIKKRYRITEAAGIFWLYDPGQEAWHYKRPVMMNEVGRDIAMLWIMGRNEEQIIDELAFRYGAETETISEDVRNFLNDLSTKGY